MIIKIWPVTQKAAQHIATKSGVSIIGAHHPVDESGCLIWDLPEAEAQRMAAHLECPMGELEMAMNAKILMGAIAGVTVDTSGSKYKIITVSAHAAKLARKRDALQGLFRTVKTHPDGSIDIKIGTDSMEVLQNIYHGKTDAETLEAALLNELTQAGGKDNPQ